MTYTAWEWDFNGDGVVDDTGEEVTHTYTDPGVYTVTLTVTDDATATNSQTKTAYIIVTEGICTVPDFANHWASEAQDLWEDFGFTTTVTVLPGKNGNDYKIRSQTLLGGTIDPQPDGCDSVITVSSRRS